MATVNKPLPPPPLKRPSGTPPQTAPTGERKFKVSKGVTQQTHKTVVYGAGGIGKSKLASLIAEVGTKPLFVDLEDGTKYLSVDRISDISTWDELLFVLRDESIWSGFGAVVIDSGTKAQELAEIWVPQNIPHEKGYKVNDISGYGWGKGQEHVYCVFLQLLQELDMHARNGRNVIVICHDCTSNVPNPAGEDWIQYQPRLQSPASGKFSIRHRVKEWADHVLFLGYDTLVDADGKGKGGGSRTCYPNEMPTHWAKSRGGITEPIPYEDDSADIWKHLLGKE